LETLHTKRSTVVSTKLGLENLKPNQQYLKMLSPWNKENLIWRGIWKTQRWRSPRTLNSTWQTTWWVCAWWNL